jgi:hypothetical protein
MAPGNWSHRLWDDSKLWTEEGIELPHREQAGAREAFHARVRGLQVQRHLLDHRRTPGALALQNVQLSADIPIQTQKLGVHGRRGRA